MKIIDKRGYETTFGQIANSNCFIYKGHVCLKTGDRALDLTTGTCVYFYDNEPVEPVNAELTITNWSDDD